MNPNLPFAQFFADLATAKLKKKQRIITACSEGDLPLLKKIGNHHCDFALGGLDWLDSPVHGAITHAQWEVVDWLLLDQQLAFSQSFLGPVLYNFSGRTPSASQLADFHYLLTTKVQDYLAFPFKLGVHKDAHISFSLWNKFLATAPSERLADYLLQITACFNRNHFPPELSAQFILVSALKHGFWHPQGNAAAQTLLHSMLARGSTSSPPTIISPEQLLSRLPVIESLLSHVEADTFPQNLFPQFSALVHKQLLCDALPVASPANSSVSRPHL